MRPDAAVDREDGLLQRCGDAERVELVHLAQLASEYRRRHAIAHPPAGDVQRLAERINREAASRSSGWFITDWCTRPSYWTCS